MGAGASGGGGGGGGPAPAGAGDAPTQPPPIDSRLPFSNYRECFTLKNYWKTVQRNKESCAVNLLYQFLNVNEPYRSKYSKLAHLTDWSDADFVMGDSHFEALATKYLELFDNVVAAVEENPGNVDSAVQILNQAGQRHKSIPGFTTDYFKAMEPAFIRMVSDILQDRFNDKAETLFQNFFAFCNKNLQ